MFTYVSIIKIHFHVYLARLVFLFLVFVFLFFNHIVLFCFLFENKTLTFPLTFVLVDLCVLDSLNRFHQVYIYFCMYKSFRSYIPFSIECGLPFFFKGFFFKKLWITHFLLTKVVDYPPLVGVIFHNVCNHVYIHGRSP
jgi:hypothetical protein